MDLMKGLYVRVLVVYLLDLRKTEVWKYVIRLRGKNIVHKTQQQKKKESREIEGGTKMKAKREDTVRKY